MIGEDDSNDAVLAISLKGGKLTGAYCNGHTLQVFEETPEDQSFGTMQSVLLQFPASVILLPARCHPDFIDAVKDCVDAERVIVKPCPSHEFGVQLGVSIVPEASEQTAGCVTAISRHLKRAEFACERVNLCDFMLLDETAARALNIFNGGQRPNRQSASSSEGISLLRLFDRCVTPMGHALLRVWFARPLLDLLQVEARLDQVELFMGNADLLHSLRKAMAKSSSVRNKLAKASPRFDASSFTSVLRLCQGALNAGGLLQAAQIHCNLELPTLAGIGSLIGDNLELTPELRVKDSVDGQLDDLRRAYEQLPEELTRISRQVAAELKRCHIAALNIIYFPQLGYLIAIPKDKMVIPPPEATFTQVFASDRLSYFKNDLMHQLDANLGDLHAQMVDREMEIEMALTKEIIAGSETLHQAERCLAELDCILSLAQCALDYKLVRPQFVEKELHFEGLRNLLQEAVTDNFIPNDLHLQDVTVLTGPNSSGKSVLLRSVGQAVHLAQMGSMVPARTAKIQPVDRILTRIVCQESSLSEAGAFEIDLRQIKRACDSLTPNSLLLIDEFGKGTVPNDGIALFAGLLVHLAQLPSPPLTLAITHFVEIYHHAIIEHSLLPISWLCMESCEEQENGQPVFLYRASKGVAISSLAMACARRAGIPEAIVQRAQQLQRLLSSTTPLQDYHLTLDHHAKQLAEDTLVIRKLLEDD